MAETPQDKKEFGYGRVSFLAHSAAISAQLSTGRMKKAVWREYRDRLGGLGYLQFLRYVARYIPQHSLNAVGSPTPPPSSLNEKRSHDNPHKAERTEQRGTFHFDPMVADIKKYV